MSLPSLLLWAALCATDASAASGVAGTATVPLDQVLALMKQQPATAPAPPPPVDAVLGQVHLSGRLSDTTLLVDATFQVDVLAAGRWTKVELLALGPDTFVAELPTLDTATVAPVDGKLTFLSQVPGRYVFKVQLAVRARRSGDERRATLRAAAGLPASPLQLQVDGAVFELVDAAVSGGEGPQVDPSEGAWTVRWRSSAPPAPARAVVRPPLEPRVPVATASWVTTLEGKATLRLRYQLQVDREQPLTLRLPEGYRVKRVELDGAPLEAAQDGRELALKVGPSRLGESAAVLEVSLAHELGVFHLSGLLRLQLPAVSWPVDELRARAHFPAVFDYRREGGSMEATDPAQLAWPQESTPLPGAVLAFRQYLVGDAAPTLELAYSVNIRNSYFR